MQHLLHNFSTLPPHKPGNEHPPRACACAPPHRHFGHVNISFSCSVDTTAAFLRTQGSADSCETDRQEAAQRNRCSVMVAAVMGGGGDGDGGGQAGILHGSARCAGGLQTRSQQTRWRCGGRGATHACDRGCGQLRGRCACIACTHSAVIQNIPRNRSAAEADVRSAELETPAESNTAQGIRQHK